MNPHPSRLADRVLLVEGQDDLHVIGQLWVRVQSSDPTWKFISKDGVGKLLASLGVEIRVPDRTVVGVVLDANGDADDRWSAVRDRLRKANIDAPDDREFDGTIIDASPHTPRVGVWIMPDNESGGELEDFVALMIPPEDPVWPRSNTYIDAIPTHDRKFGTTKTTRARVHSWLATREDPRQMGLAIRTRDLDVDGELCERFAGWLRRLFD